MLLTDLPDLYLVDQPSFIRLYRMGYLLELTEWDTYGLDVSGSSLMNVLGLSAEQRRGPIIAAVSRTSARAEHATRLLRRYASDGLHSVHDALTR